MKRKEFLVSALGLLEVACMERPAQAPPPPPAPPPALPPPLPPVAPRHYKHWAWLTAQQDANDEHYRRLFANMQGAGVSAVLLEAFNGGEAFYQSQHLPTRADWLARVLPLAKAAGLETHAWVWGLPCTIDSVIQAHPEWFVVNKNGESTAEHPVYLPHFRFLCPTRAPVREFIKQRVVELSGYPVDGIHLDYLQLPQVILPLGLQAQYGVKQEEGQEEAAYDYCYCEVCRAKFKEQTNIDPLNFNQPEASDAWRQFRYDRLTELVNQDLVPVIQQAGKLASAAVLPDWEAGRQEWSRWSLQAVLPQLHHALYEQDITWIGFQTQLAVERIASQTACYSGLLVSHLSAPDLSGAVRLAIESGARGVGLFSAQAMSELHWRAFRDVTEQLEQDAVG